MQARNTLIALAIRNKGDWNKIYSDIQNKEYPSEEELAQAEKADCITILDSDYPESLKQGFKPPFVLFYKGNKALLNDTDILAVVGTRQTNDRILNFTEKFVSSRTETIINGLSAGTNTKALKIALKNGNKAIAVLGSGIDYCYPGESKEVYDELVKKGLIISEYPFDTLPQKDNFPFRNRIIAGLSKAICVMSVEQHSGTIILINYALSQGKEIYIAPDIEENNYANELIEEGANCLTLATQIN